MNESIDYSQLPLRDIHLPEAVGWWPPAPGWWVLLAMLVAGALYALWRYARGYRQRAALRALEQVREALGAGEPVDAWLPIVSSVLRRFAMTVAPNPRGIAGLVGERWLTWLDSQWETPQFTSGPGRALMRAPYAPASAFSNSDALELTDVCIAWVRAQKVAS